MCAIDASTSRVGCFGGGEPDLLRAFPVVPYGAVEQPFLLFEVERN